MAFANRKFALADPVPFTLANLTTKSFTLLIHNTCYLPLQYYIKIDAYPMPLLDIALHTDHSVNTGLHLSPLFFRFLTDPYAGMSCSRFKAGTKSFSQNIFIFFVEGEGNAIGWANVHTSITLYTLAIGEYGLHIAVEASLSLFKILPMGRNPI